MVENTPPGSILLASGSPRRRELLDQIGVAYRVLPAGIDESVRPGEDPETYTCRIAQEKVLAAKVRRAPGEIVLGADTAVVLGEQMLGKPGDQAGAMEMLRALSGRTHEVYTAVAVLDPRDVLDVLLNVSEVTFAELDDAWIQAYVATGEPMDKAGAYGIQGWAGCQIRRVSGSYSSIMGLPLYETAQLLAKADLRLPQIPRREA
jgi:septum formation protein